MRTKVKSVISGILTCALWWPMTACDRESSKPTPQTPPSERPKRSTDGTKPPSFGSMDPAFYEKWRARGFSSMSHVYPSRDVEQLGLLTERGLRDCFRQIVGASPPEWMKPVFGRYEVRKYTTADTGNFNCWVGGYFRIPPERSEELRVFVIEEWHRSLADVDHVTIREKTLRSELAFYPEFTFAAGSLNTYVTDDREVARDIEHSYQVLIDPTSGLVYLKSFRGDEE